MGVSPISRAKEGMPRGKRRRGIYFSKKRRRWPWILLILIAFIILISATAYISQSPGEISPHKRAAILDGLSADYPNRTFINSAEKILESAGFTVDIYGPENVSLSLLRELPSKDYGLVIFRVHGGRIKQPMGLFIGGGLFIERCGPESHKDEVESGYLLLGRPFLSNDTYCVAPPHYITDKLDGEFEGTIIIAMSCFTGDDKALANAFFKRGAKAYIGFKGKVSPAYVDAFITRFLQKIFIEKLPIKEAFTQTSNELGLDPHYGGAPVLFLP